jgi:glycosyltransferase 2 family protein
MPTVEADIVDGEQPPRTSGWRRLAAAVVIVLVVIAAAYAIYRDRHSFADTIRRVGLLATIASFAAGLAGVAATYPAWRQVLAGLGVRLPWADGAQVFFASQLGKYLPGSVWPVLLQMEAGRARGASRRTMLAGNLITVVLSCATGLLVACLLLPISDAHALAHYWWVLLALPPLLVLLHPRAMTATLDRLFRLVGRAPLGERLPVSATLEAGAWSIASWLGLGLQVWILYAAAGHTTFSGWLLCTGGMALAVSAGILFIPAPAGAGLRELILVLVLKPDLGTGGALAIVVASRVLLVIADLALAAGAFAFRTRGRERHSPPVRPPTPLGK